MFNQQKQINLITDNIWQDYELIDCGNFEKLERFGKYILIRPEPQAMWDKFLSDKEWEKLAHTRFISKSSSSGIWQKFKPMPDQWQITYHNQQNHLSINFRLGLTNFKHVGIFPEQANNWNFIYNNLKKINTNQPKFLNLFAYTGGASLAAKQAGADVTHVDAIKQVVTWANQNMTINQQKDIRWIVEDAMKFVNREIKRGNKYHGIILDPPAYGHGPNGESWKLEKQINEIISKTLQLLAEQHLYILNVYSLGLSPLIIQNLLENNKILKINNLETAEVYTTSNYQHLLPLGIVARFKNF